MTYNTLISAMGAHWERAIDLFLAKVTGEGISLRLVGVRHFFKCVSHVVHDLGDQFSSCFMCSLQIVTPG